MLDGGTMTGRGRLATLALCFSIIHCTLCARLVPVFNLCFSHNGHGIKYMPFRLSIASCRKCLDKIAACFIDLYAGYAIAFIGSAMLALAAREQAQLVPERGTHELTALVEQRGGCTYDTKMTIQSCDQPF